MHLYLMVALSYWGFREMGQLVLFSDTILCQKKKNQWIHDIFPTGLGKLSAINSKQLI